MASPASAPTTDGITHRPTRPSSFSRSINSSAWLPPSPGIKQAFNFGNVVSSGIPHLDKILGGGFRLGTLVMIMEDGDAPHHLLLLRNFMAQGVVHGQSILFASPLKEPWSFLGTLPSVVALGTSLRDERSRDAYSVDRQEQEKGLRIAWQYKKYFDDQHGSDLNAKDLNQDFCNEFDLRKPMGRHILGAQPIECICLQDASSLATLREHCSVFLSKHTRNDGGNSVGGRIAIQSLCAPQNGYSELDWEMLSFIRSLKAMVRCSNAVAVVTFPSSCLKSSVSKRWQHLADTLLSVRALPDEDKEMDKLLTGYKDMLGLLHVHKVAQINTQVPDVLEVSTFSLKLHKRRSLVLERLNQAPVEASSGSSYATSTSCSGSSKGSSLDF